MKFALVVPAAGSGSRLGHSVPKALIEISGKPLFVHAVLPFLEFDDLSQVVIACPAQEVTRFQAQGERFLSGGRFTYLVGGATRQNSVANALSVVEQTDGLVLIHDAARPFVSRALIERVIGGASGEFAAAIPGVAVCDTLKRASGNPREVSETIRRDDIFAVQTPQALKLDIARRMHDTARRDGFQATDDAALVEHYGLGKVRLVDGEAQNFKLTTAGDFARAQELLSSRI